MFYRCFYQYLLKWKRSFVHGNQLSQHPKNYNNQELRKKMELQMESNRKFKAQTSQKTEELSW